MSIVLYGIKNCDTVKKTRRWLEKQQIEYIFHDFRADGLDKKMLESFLIQVDWQILLNKRGTTWRKIPAKQKEKLNKTNVIKLMLDHPTIIKRPVLCHDTDVFVGFSEDKYKEIFT